jgi:hypothetical protein
VLLGRKKSDAEIIWYKRGENGALLFIAPLRGDNISKCHIATYFLLQIVFVSITIINIVVDDGVCAYARRPSLV